MRIVYVCLFQHMYGFSGATFSKKCTANEKIENYSYLNIITLELLTAVVHRWTTNRSCLCCRVLCYGYEYKSGNELCD